MPTGAKVAIGIVVVFLILAAAAPSEAAAEAMGQAFGGLLLLGGLGYLVARRAR